MTLEDKEKEFFEKEAQEQKQKKDENVFKRIEPKTKKQIATEIAMKYNDLPEPNAKQRVAQETPCSLATAHYAVKAARKAAGVKAGAQPVKITVESEQEKKPEFMQEPEQIKPLEEVHEPTEIITPEMQEQLDVMRDMMRGVYALILSEEGILGRKYGRPKEQCVQVSDQLYRWLSRRISPDQLTKYDTMLLIISHVTLIGGIAKVYLDDRKKAEVKGEPKK